MRHLITAALLVSLTPADAKPVTPSMIVGAPAPPIIAGKLRHPVKRPKPHKKSIPLPPVKHHKDRGDFDAAPVAEKDKEGGCHILKHSDPEDDMAYMLWSAYIGSPRHSTRAAWDRFDSQPVFFRMARAALSICGPTVEVTVSTVPK
jgi:hypothetical protein